ncbi:hypothetical protein BUALT_Bualt01G0117200 [Buddleja alternifolia]|uniref:Uncharacterized protein n=1 Tax=Buddleja alternifolia TaxID=168488 RepID=A0AAV6YCB3_9LAMI|nr:hypothetical protein BUALT_Bualt01G0117200 [Buddleja alternifolia]
MEWEIVDYSEDEDEEKEKSKLGWILSAGLRLGKKLVITGVVISSVPIVVPPLVVISALGMAFSVPFGFVFASYACTQKLMSKLLLLPPSSSSSQMIDDEEEEDEGILVDYDIIEKEEKEQGEALKDGIEMRIELADDGPGAEQEISSVKFTDKEAGYEELDVEGKDDQINPNDLTADDEKPYAFNITAVDGGNAIKTHHVVAQEVLRNTEHMQILDVKTTIMPMPLSSTSSQTNNFNEEVEKNENVERNDENVFSEMKGTDKETVTKEKSSSSKKFERRAKRKKSSGKRKEAEGEKKRHEKEKELLLEETKTSSSEKGKVEAVEKEQSQQVVVEEEKNVVDDVCSSEKEHAHESEDLNNNIQARIIENIVVIDDDSGSSLEKEEKPMWQGQSVRNGVVSDEAKMSTDLVASAAKTSFENNLILNGKVGVGEKVSQEVVIEEEKDIQDVSSDSAARQHIMLESHEDLNDNIQTSSGENIVMNDDLEKFEKPLEKEEKPVSLKMSSQGQSVVLRDGVLSEANMSCTGLVTSETSEENYTKIADDLENSSRVAPSKLEHNEETPELKEEEDASALAYRDEEKIWKEIEAIRVIVGFRAPTCPSYFDELKALYLFTGIEPPSSFTNPSDIPEFCNKLRFLKSVIGLK